MLNTWSARTSQVTDWCARDARDLWTSLTFMERQQVSRWIVPELLKQAEAVRGAAYARRMFGCLQLCALEDGYPVTRFP